jgi:choline dehydrogenase-like flavoprotein
VIEPKEVEMDEPVVVVGSGPSGAVAAAQLVERGVRVVMLDAGTHAPGGLIVRAAGNTMFRRMAWADFDKDRLAEGSSADVLWLSSVSNGGLSNFWTGAVPRFAPEDFTEGGRLDERYVWPVRYDELAPYYEIAERHLDVTAGDPIPGVPANTARHRTRPPKDWRHVIAAANANGDPLGTIPLAKGDPWMIARRGTEFSSYHCVVEGLLTSPLFELRRGAHVTRLGWSSTSGAVDTVEYLDRATRQKVDVHARAVVVAAGAIDTTMLLLRSTSPDFPDGLGNSSGNVGRYLHDHPRQWWSATIDRPMRALAHPLYLARVPYADSAPLLSTSHTIGLAAPVERLRTYVRARSSRLGVQVFGTMIPRPHVGVALDRHHDLDAPVPRAVISHSYDQDEIANIESARRRLCDVFGAAGLGASVNGPFHPVRPGTSVHYGGTVRMHDDPRFGVLDRWNRMHDVPNVIVCDMACFTTGPEKNPTPTAMALAIRAADHLAAEL